ncbi:MAG: tetratricopeptide repeat protein [Myxococcales bacterium]|nr:tetratricopeptide repeat protein [Myxococcales bacterium]
MLQDDPEDASAIEGLREALASKDPERMGEQPERLLEVARHGHERRGELQAVAWLIEVELEAFDADARFAVALLKELARIKHEELLDDAGAIAASRRALELSGGQDEALEQSIEELEHTAEKWRAIADRFLEEAKDSSDPGLKASLLARAGSLVWQYRPKGKNKEVDKIFGQALKVDPSSVRAARLYAITLRARDKWADVGAVLRTTADAARNRDEKLNLYVAAARVLSRKVDDPASAAACYERVLDFAPGHEEALRFLVDYFTQREEWDHLVALYEDALRSRQKLESEQGILLQIGMVHWRIRGRAEEAEPHFARLRKIEPAHPGMIDFYRDHLGTKAAAGGPEADEARQRYLTVLSDAQRATDDPSTKLTLAVELAKLAQGSEATERAIDAWKAVQRLEPANAEAGSALRALYRRGQKWNALVETMRSELDALPASSDDPEIKRRRVALLRELIAIYRDELKLDAMAVSTYNQLLEEQPDDVGALAQLAATYESMGRWNDLIQVVTRMADAEDDASARVDLLMRVARLWIDRFANYNQATKPLESVIELDPDNREALGELKTIYAKKRAWKQLFAVLEKEARLTSDPDARFESTLELAKLAGERLHQHGEAIALWKQVLTEREDTPGGVDTLEKLSEREKDWASLAWALELRAKQTAGDAERVKILQKLGVTYGEHMNDPAKAAEAWKAILAVDPKNGRALRTLRDSFLKARDFEGLEALYAESEDWEGLVDVLGNAAERADDPELTKALSFRAASLYRDRLGNPERAFRSYERVLSVEPGNVEAASALVPIYEQQGKWPQVLRLKQVLLDHVPDEDADARADALLELSALSADRLNDDEGAFRFARDAYGLRPDDTARTRMERLAATVGGHEALAAAYEARLAEATDEDEIVGLRRKLAATLAGPLGRLADAARPLEAVLALRPTDAETLDELEHIYTRLDRAADLQRLREHQLEHATSDDERLGALASLARLEEQAGRPEEAAARYRSMLELDAEHAGALEALDRLATEAGRWDEVVSVLERRRALATDRAALSLRLGELYRTRLGDPARALACFAEVASDDPRSDAAREGLEALAAQDGAPVLEIGTHLERIYEVTGRTEQLRDVLAVRLERSTDEDEKRALQLRVAEIAAMLGDPAGAYAALESAFLEHPSDVDLWDRLARAADAADRHAACTEAFATALEVAELEPADAVALARRVAELYASVIGEPAKAEPHHKRVLSFDPQDDAAFLALKELYTEQERWDELQALYRNRIAETLDADAKRELLLQVCFLFEEILEDVSLAIRAYQEVLELDPDHSASRRALDRLYRRAERWRDLVALLGQELERGVDPRQEIDLVFEIGELHEQKLEEPALAVDHYERVLERQPTHVRAQQALERLIEVPSQRQRIAALLEPLYDGQGAWPELARILRVQLEDASEPSTRLALLLRLATLEEDRLGSAERAFDALAQAVLTEPGDASVREELARIATLRGVDGQRADVLAKAVDAAEGSTFLQAELLLELARLLDERVGDAEKAEAAYRRLIAVDGDNPDSVLPAARALERIHLAANAPAAVADDLRLQIRLELDDEARRGLLVRLATLLEELGQVEAAVGVHRQRLELDPDDLEAMLALERLYEQTADWQRLIGVLQSREQVVSDEAEQRAVALRIGQVYEEELGDSDSAIVAFNDALSRFGGDEATLGALARLYEKTEKYDDLLEILEMKLGQVDGDERRAELRFRMGEILRTKTRDIERAVEAYGEVLELSIGHEGVLNALEEIVTDPDAPFRVEAARVLAPQLEATQRWSELVDVLEVVAESDDPVERLGALRRAAAIAEMGREDHAQAFALLSRAVRVGVVEPELPEMLVDLERYAAASGQHEAHAALLEEVAPEILDGDQQVASYRQAATIARDRLGDVERARRLLRRVLEARPDDVRALDALLSLQEQAGDHAALLETLRRKTEVAETPAERITLLERQAALCEEQLGDVQGAIDAWEQVLLEDPRHLAAYEAIARLHEGAERWSDVIAALERMLDADIGSTVQVRHRIARTHVEHAGDLHAALDQLREAVARDPSHEPSVQLLERLLEDDETRREAAEVLEPVFLARMDWPRVLSTLEARLRSTDETEERKAILAKLGEIHEDQLEDLEAALDDYARLFAEDIRDRHSWETVARLGRVLDAGPRVAEVYATAVDAEGVVDEDTATLARMAGRGLAPSSPERAATLWSRVLEYEATDREAFEALEAIHRAASAHDALLELYGRRVEVAESDEERVLLLHRIASLHEGERSDPEAAVEAYRRALELEPGDLGAAEALDRLLAGAERWEDLAEHLRFRIDGVVGTPEETDLKHRLAGLLAERLEDTVTAIDLLEENVEARPDHTPSIASLERLVTQPEHQLRVTRILEPLYRAADQWKKLIAVLEAQAAMSDDAVERVRLLGEIARLHEERGGDLAWAFDAWTRAFVTDPLDEDAQAELDRLAGSLGAWDEHVAAYEQALAACGDATRVSQLLGAVARIHDERRGDPRAAIQTYERLVEHDTEDLSALDALEALHTLVGDWQGLVDILKRKVERVFDPTERADLLRRAASVLEELLGDPKGAIGLYEQAAQEDEADPIALEALDRIYTSASDFESLARVLDRRMVVEEDEELRVELGLRLAQLFETQLSRFDDAIDALNRVLELSADQPDAVQSLGRLYERQALWPELLENLKLRAALAPDVAARVQLVHRAGEITERELDDVPEALVLYEQALQLDGRHEPSLQALVRISHLEDYRLQAAEVLEPLLLVQERWDVLADLKRLKAEVASDPYEKKRELRALAEVREAGLRDPAGAFDALARAFAEDPADEEVAEELERLAAITEAYPRFADELAARAGASFDPTVARGLWVRLARIAEERLSDPARAIDAYTRALEQVGDDEELLAVLDRLYLGRQSWTELAGILERRINLANDPTERAELLVRLGEVRETHFADLRGAFAAYQEVVERDPNDARALDGLQRLGQHEELALEVVDTLEAAFRETGALDRIAALYDVRINLASSDGERVQMLQDAARLWEDELGQPEKAAQVIRRAFTVDPRDATLLAELERLAAGAGAWESLRGLVEELDEAGALDGDLRRDLNLRAAGWYRVHLGDLGAAEARLRVALEADPESHDAHEALIEALREGGREVELVAALRAWSEVENDDLAKRDRLCEAARLAESALGDTSLAATLYASALEADGTHVEALDALLRLRQGESKWQEVAQLLARRIDVEMDGDARLGFRRQLAETLAGPLGDPAGATEAFEAVLFDAPEDLETIEALEGLYANAERWDDLRGLLDRRLDLAATDADRVGVRVRLARLAEQAFGRRDDAIAQLREILELDARNAEALAELERLLAADGQWAEVIEILERRADDAAAIGAVDTQKACLVRLATIHEEQGEPAQARTLLERVLTLDPDDVDALRTLIGMHEAADDVAALVDGLERLRTLVPPEEAVAICHRVATLASDRLGDSARAGGALYAALALQPSETTRELLKAHHEAHGEWAELASLLEGELDGLEAPAEKVALLRRLADLHRKQLGDAAAGARFLEQAVALTPDDREVLLPLCDLYIAADRQRDAIPVLEKIIESFGTRRSKELASYHHRLGQALDGLGETEKALAAFDAAFRIDLTNIDVLRDLGRLTLRTGDLARAQKTFRALLLQKLDDGAGITKADVYFHLGEISAKEGDAKKAISMLERAVAEQPGHAEATALLNSLKG